MRQLIARLNPSFTDSGGTQPNKLHAFEISTCKLPHKRCTAFPLPSNDAPACKAHTGMEVVIIRPPLVYGPGVKANFADLMHANHWC